MHLLLVVSSLNNVKDILSMRRINIFEIWDFQRLLQFGYLDYQTVINLHVIGMEIKMVKKTKARNLKYLLLQLSIMGKIKDKRSSTVDRFSGSRHHWIDQNEHRKI